MDTPPKMRGDDFHRRVRIGPGERQKVIRELYEAHARSLAGRFRRAGLAKAQAEDGVQAVFVKLCDKWETIRGDEPPIHWLNRVASNEIVNFYRDRSKHSMTGSDITNRAGTTPPEHDAVPDEGADAPATASAKAESQEVAPAGARPANMPAPAAPWPRNSDDPAPASGGSLLTEEDARLRAFCSRQSLEAFRRDFPVEADLLFAYELGDIDMDAVREALDCASVGAAAERMSVCRKRLRTYCFQFCESIHCL